MKKSELKCIKCGAPIVIKSFRPIPAKRTKEGYVCKECLNAANKEATKTGSEATDA